MTVRFAPLALLLPGLLFALPAEGRDKPGKKAGKKAPSSASAGDAAATAGCKEPAGKDPDLVAGLAHYAAGRWSDAARTLAAWAAKPGADQDPGVARGLYSLAYSQRATGGEAAAGATMARLQPILVQRTTQSPTLEAWYYLQGLHQMQSDSTSQLAAIASALRALDAGELCARRDGDDWFRIARLQGFAGNAAARSDALRAAADAYATLPADAPASPYRAMVEKDLGDAALTSNDLEAAERHLAEAARLDPTIPGVHRQLGLVYLQRGNVEAAATHWRRNWKNERQGGNAFMYAIPVMQKVIAYRKRTADSLGRPATPPEPLSGLSQFTVPALEANAKSEAATFFTLQQERMEADAADAPFPEEKLAQMEAAEYRALQYLLEYVTRGEDLQEFALQNGLLPLIHGKGLPKREG